MIHMVKICRVSGGSDGGGVRNIRGAAPAGNV